MIKKILNKILATIVPLSVHYNNERLRFLKYSLIKKVQSDKNYILTNLAILTHDIEKGMSLKNPRNGFGKKKIEQIMFLLDLYYRKYKDNNFIIENANKILLTYYENKELYKFDEDLCKKCLEFTKSNESDLGTITKNTINTKFTNFSDFAKSRHSVRYFLDKSIDIECISKIIDIAKSAPSACNRQSVRVIAIIDDSKIKKILELHGGAKGFENCKVLFLITSIISKYTYQGETSTPYIDGGIFEMNLLYAMHSEGVGSCPLIWNDNDGRDKALREIISINENEIVTGMIVGGYYTNCIKYAVSKRLPTSEILTIIK